VSSLGKVIGPSDVSILRDTCTALILNRVTHSRRSFDGRMGNSPGYSPEVAGHVLTVPRRSQTPQLTSSLQLQSIPYHSIGGSRNLSVLFLDHTNGLSTILIFSFQYNRHVCQRRNEFVLSFWQGPGRQANRKRRRDQWHAHVRGSAREWRQDKDRHLPR